MCSNVSPHPSAFPPNYTAIALYERVSPTNGPCATPCAPLHPPALPSDFEAPCTKRASGLLQGLGIRVRHAEDIIDSDGFLQFLSQREFPRAASSQLPGLLATEVCVVAGRVVRT